MSDIDLADETGKLLCPICQTWWDDLQKHDQLYHSRGIVGVRAHDRITLEITNEEGEISHVVLEVLSDEDGALDMLSHPVPTETVQLVSIERPTYYQIG